jgi:hypothetical protein
VRTRRFRILTVAAAVAVALITAGGQWSAASAAGPPFTQCPQVGQAPSCTILIVINADRSVSVLGDANVGPYDGGDDTLVGVQNNSSTYVQAITVTGPGSGLSTFDGDGLCTYSVSGCPFGPTGYEGPDVSFTVDPSLPDSAEVDFGSGGLGPNSSDYFSLEGALTQAVITARQGGLGGYVALGDSYSSGEGAGQYGWNSQLPNDNCDRSPNAYGPLLDSDRALGPLTFVACSGAITADMFDPNHEGNININTNQPEDPQLNALTADTKTVTLTMGGNDVGFGHVLAQCLFGEITSLYHIGHAGCAHDTSLTETVYSRLRALEGTGSATTPGGEKIHSLLSILEAIHSRASKAKIYLAGYPRLFGSFKGECGVGTIYVNNVPVIGYGAVAVKITGSDAAWLNQTGSLLMQVVNDAVASAQMEGIPVTAVDPNPEFASHRLCDTGTSWIFGVSGTANYKDQAHSQIDAWSFHPTVSGQNLGYEAAFLKTSIGQ